MLDLLPSIMVSFPSILVYGEIPIERTCYITESFGPPEQLKIINWI